MDLWLEIGTDLHDEIADGMDIVLTETGIGYRLCAGVVSFKTKVLF